VATVLTVVTFVTATALALTSLFLITAIMRAVAAASLALFGIVMSMSIMVTRGLARP